MKQIFVFLLIGCISAQSFVRTAWTIHYQWNRAVYLKNCENRDKPNLHCDGKCYLKKKMAASENNNPKEPRLPEGFRQIQDIQLFFESFDLFPRLAGIPEGLTAIPRYARRFLPDVSPAGIFKPPAV
ncbi:MAG TPA: hypothetical protein PK228_06465 [Saprospiraceae bacterium]|nr:hypothetical protein [Saprospiraceae bacterium]